MAGSGAGEVAVLHSQHPGRTLGPGQLDLIVKIMPDQALLEHRPDQLSMATQHRLTYRRVQHQGNKRSGVGVHAKVLVGLDGEAAAPGQRLDSLQTAHRWAAQDPVIGTPRSWVNSPWASRAAGLSPTGRSRSGPAQARLSPAWA